MALAAEVIDKGVHVLSPRGERFTPDSIGPRLNMRDFMDTMRSRVCRCKVTVSPLPVEVLCDQFSRIAGCPIYDDAQFPVVTHDTLQS